MTFCVALADAVSGALGIGVASKYLAVGSIVPYAAADAGIVATQFFANPQYGPRGLELLRAGLPPAEVIEILLAHDPHRVRRQLFVMDASGAVAGYTGPACLQSAGEVTAEGVGCSGNTLMSDAVLPAAFKSLTEHGGAIWDRLLNGLIAAQTAGGDKSGQQSASLLVVQAGRGYGGNSDRLVDLRVDDHPLPLEELRRILDVWRMERDTNAA